MSGVGRAHRISVGSFMDAVQREALWPGVVLLLGGAGGTVVAHLVATWPSDPAAGSSVARTAMLVVASLVALGIGTEVVVSAERSPMRHVFVSDSLRRTSVALVGVAALLVVATVVLGCFR